MNTLSPVNNAYPVWSASRKTARPGNPKSKQKNLMWFLRLLKMRWLSSGSFQSAPASASSQKIVCVNDVYGIAGALDNNHNTRRRRTFKTATNWVVFGVPLMPPQKHELNSLSFYFQLYAMTMPGACDSMPLTSFLLQTQNFDTLTPLCERTARMGYQPSQNLGKRRSESQPEDEHETTRQSVV